MNKRILLPLAILPAFQAGNVQAADQPAKRPNIILFMVDDMGYFPALLDRKDALQRNVRDA